jgi:hypothetical protein
MLDFTLENINAEELLQRLRAVYEPLAQSVARLRPWRR